jgi:hypothetical protein
VTNPNARYVLIVLLVLVVIAHFAGGLSLAYSGSLGTVLLVLLVLVLLGVL